MSKDWTFDALNHSSLARRCLWLDFNVPISMALVGNLWPIDWPKPVCGCLKLLCIVLMDLVPRKCWTNYFATMFQLCRITRSSTTMFVDLLLACYLANTTCAIINAMTALIFIILIVSRLHAFFLVAPVRSSLHVLLAVVAISYFQHTPAVRSNDICLSLNLLSLSVVINTSQ